MERDRQGVIRFFQGNVMKGAEGRVAGRDRRRPTSPRPSGWRPRRRRRWPRRTREREAEVVEGDVVRETETPRSSTLRKRSGPVGARPTARPRPRPPDEERPAARSRPPPGARAAKSAARRKEPKAAKEPRAKKSVSKPRGGRKKVAVAATLRRRCVVCGVRGSDLKRQHRLFRFERRRPDPPGCGR